MKFFIKVLLVVPLLLTATLAYSAGCGLRERIERIEERIDRGIANGSLTDGEARRLERGREEIRELRRELKSDGYMSDRDCMILERKVDRLSDRVRWLKHNERRRDDYGGYDRPYRRSYGDGY